MQTYTLKTGRRGVQLRGAACPELDERNSGSCWEAGNGVAGTSESVRVTLPGARAHGPTPPVSTPALPLRTANTNASASQFSHPIDYRKRLTSRLLRNFKA